MSNERAQALREMIVWKVKEFGRCEVSRQVLRLAFDPVAQNLSTGFTAEDIEEDESSTGDCLDASGLLSEVAVDLPGHVTGYFESARTFAASIDCMLYEVGSHFEFLDESSTSTRLVTIEIPVRLDRHLEALEGTGLFGSSVEDVVLRLIERGIEGHLHTGLLVDHDVSEG